MTLLISVIMVVAHSYIGWRSRSLINNLTSNTFFRWSPVLFLATFYLLPLIGMGHYLLWGDVDMLTLSQPITYWFWFGLVWSVHLFSWLIVLDLLFWLIRFVIKDRDDSLKQYYAVLFAVISIGFFCWTGVKMIRDTTRIHVRHTTFKSPRVPAGIDNFRIVHITDIQGDEFTGRQKIARYIKKVNALHPDIIIFTGDLVSYGTDFIDIAAEELSHAKSTLGTYAVIGDHDYWAGADRVTSALRANGVHVIRDENVIIPFHNDSLLLTGITEVYSEHIPRDSLQALTQHPPQASFKMLATHQATRKVIDQAKKTNYPLLLAGHTHGGQLRIPFLWITFSAAELDTPYLSGIFHFGNMTMNVDNGLGFTLAPVRYNAPPSISVIDLKVE